MDKTVKLWDLRRGICANTFYDHFDEILDICFNPTGTLLASASSDKISNIYSVLEFNKLRSLEGHQGAINKVIFNP